MGLQEYKRKRNFQSTREPAGKVHPSAPLPEHKFVVQKHAARRLHYDFRLEMDGVLKSWAVPKGFPTTKGDRRLAVEVEDHPLEYAGFEGTIPAGNYGAGTVMVWDEGTYQVSGDDPVRSLADGKLHFWLKGRKLKGEWTLVRMRPRPNEDKPQWLLLKSGDDVAPFSKRAETLSVRTHRSLEQIAADEHGPEWESNRSTGTTAPGKASPSRRRAAPASTAEPRSKNRVQKAERVGSSRRSSEKPRQGAISTTELGRLPEAKPGFVEPMKALLVEKLPEGKDWIYEIKFDGVRALGIKTKGEPRLISRANKDLSAKYDVITEALDELSADEFVLDGEVVALDEQGRSSFQLLQSYQSSPTRPPLLYYVFDLLNVRGKDLTGLSLEKRKGLLADLLAEAPASIRFSASFETAPSRLVREMQSRGLEGLVAKRKDSRYERGRRSGSWAKYKWTREQEFVIGGYTEPQGARTHFGALLVGYYQDGQLHFAAKVGTGFSHALLADLSKKFQPLVLPTCPFVNLPERLPGGLTASEMRHCTWLEPKLVCQVRFAEWTRDNHLRQPAFLGLREDKSAEEVIRETPQ